MKTLLNAHQLYEFLLPGSDLATKNLLGLAL